MAPVLDRCRHTGLTIPECSCADCLRSLVERHAPHVLAASAARPKPAVAEPEAEVGAPRGWVGTLEYWLPPVLLMAAIFALSAQPDLNSGLGTADMIGRKIVHLAEYALLCLLWVRALRTKVAPRAASVGAFALVVGYACSDELHQHFVPGRHGTPTDIVIDAAGALIALLVLRHRSGRTSGAHGFGRMLRATSR